MSALESQFNALKHLCRLCGDPVERVEDVRTHYSGRESAFGYRGCSCGHYILEHTAQLAIDARFTMGHPIRLDLSHWVHGTGAELRGAHWPVVTMGVVDALARDRARSAAAQEAADAPALGAEGTSR